MIVDGGETRAFRLCPSAASSATMQTLACTVQWHGVRILSRSGIETGVTWCIVTACRSTETAFPVGVP